MGGDVEASSASTAAGHSVYGLAIRKQRIRFRRRIEYLADGRRLEFSLQAGQPPTLRLRPLDRATALRKTSPLSLSPLFRLKPSMRRYIAHFAPFITVVPSGAAAYTQMVGQHDFCDLVPGVILLSGESHQAVSCNQQS
jgi:hypothetical protein